MNLVPSPDGTSERMHPRAARALIVAFVLAICVNFFYLTDARSEEAFVTNEKDSTISVIDVAKLSVVRTIKTGTRPRGIVASTDGKTLFVCASDSNRIEFINSLDGARIGQVDNVPDPEQLALSPDGRLLYATNEEDNAVSVIDVAEQKIIGVVEVGVEPEGVAVSPDGKFAVATSETTNMLHMIDAASLKLVENILVGARPRVAEFSPDGRQIWVSSEIGGTVSVINSATLRVEKEIGFVVAGVRPDKIQPVGVRFSKDAKTVFVALGAANRVAVVDANTYEIVKFILVGKRVWHLFLSQDGRKLFTTNGGSNDVTVIDTSTLEATKSITVGRQPWGVVTVAVMNGETSQE